MQQFFLPWMTAIERTLAKLRYTNAITKATEILIFTKVKLAVSITCRRRKNFLIKSILQKLKSWKVCQRSCFHYVEWFFWRPRNETRIKIFKKFFYQIKINVSTRLEIVNKRYLIESAFILFIP